MSGVVQRIVVSLPTNPVRFDSFESPLFWKATKDFTLFLNHPPIELFEYFLIIYPFIGERCFRKLPNCYMLFCFECVIYQWIRKCNMASWARESEFFNLFILSDCKQL